MFADSVVIPPVAQRDPASPTSPKARSVGTEKAGDERYMTHPDPQANVAISSSSLMEKLVVLIQGEGHELQDKEEPV